MTVKDYEDVMWTSKFYNYKQLPIIYPVLGINGEAGEVAEKIKKVIRDNNGEFTYENKREIAKELGDVLWYIWATATDMGYSLEDIMQMNIDKVVNRITTDTIHGNGDNREEDSICNCDLISKEVTEVSRVIKITGCFNNMKEVQYDLIYRNDNNITIKLYSHLDTCEYKGQFIAFSKIDGGIIIKIDDNDINDFIEKFKSNDPFYQCYINDIIINEKEINITEYINESN